MEAVGVPKTWLWPVLCWHITSQQGLPHSPYSLAVSLPKTIFPHLPAYISLPATAQKPSLATWSKSLLAFKALYGFAPTYTWHTLLRESALQLPPQSSEYKLNWPFSWELPILFPLSNTYPLASKSFSSFKIQPQIPFPTLRKHPQTFSVYSKFSQLWPITYTPLPFFFLVPVTYGALSYSTYLPIVSFPLNCKHLEGRVQISFVFLFFPSIHLTFIEHLLHTRYRA